jgi:hypothetical protein
MLIYIVPDDDAYVMNFKKVFDFIHICSVSSVRTSHMTKKYQNESTIATNTGTIIRSLACLIIHFKTLPWNVVFLLIFLHRGCFLDPSRI